MAFKQSGAQKRAKLEGKKQARRQARAEQKAARNGGGGHQPLYSMSFPSK